MDKERSRDVLLRGRSSPAKRQQMMRGSSTSPPVGGSEGEEGEPFNPLLRPLASVVIEECDAVDPALVPRKLRSAMNKRGNQSASPPLLDVEKKQHLPFDAMGNSKQKKHGEVRENLSSGNAMSFPSSLGVSVQCYSGNRSLQQTKSDIPLLPPPKTDGNHWLFGSAVSDMKVNKERLAKKSTEKEAAPSVQHRLSNTNHGHMAVPSSYIGAVFPDTSIGVARPSPTGNHDKLPISNFGHKKSWKNCATHVYIGHLIEVYQNKEKMQASSATPLDRSKPGVGSKPRDGLQNGFNFVSPPKPRDGLQNGFNFVSPPAKNITFVDRNVHEVKMHASHNGRLLPIHHQRPDIHETHSQPRMGYDLLSLSAGHEAHISGNGMRTSGQLHAPFLQPHVPPQHSAMPFPFSHIPYTQPYPENLVSPANQQIQLQLPHYVGNPFYVSYGNIPGSSPKLQQQQQQQQQQQKHFSPVHMAQYRPPWSNGKLHDSSSLAPIQLRLRP
uniref:Uncharacterized protein n=1 Tax=Ananas comosus var. bracteatus TaxID=296719 RepID=A0A6V7QBY7_ANACO|nr:unnamed protein product [Ananas comosus var. bracteatus]